MAFVKKLITFIIGRQRIYWLNKQATFIKEVFIEVEVVSYLEEDPYLVVASFLEVAFSFLVVHRPFLEVNQPCLEEVL